LKSEDNSYYYFESLVPGFSNFAITGTAIVTPVVTNETQQMIQAASTPTTANTSGGSPSGFASNFGFIQSDNFAFAVIIVSVLAMIIIFARAKTKSEPRKPQSPQQSYSYQGRYLKTKQQ